MRLHDTSIRKWKHVFIIQNNISEHAQEIVCLEAGTYPTSSPELGSAVTESVLKLLQGSYGSIEVNITVVVIVSVECSMLALLKEDLSTTPWSVLELLRLSIHVAVWLVWVTAMGQVQWHELIYVDKTFHEWNLLSLQRGKLYVQRFFMFYVVSISFWSSTKSIIINFCCRNDNCLSQWFQ